MAAAVKAKKMQDVTVLGIAGDGGTADIGLQALSGAVERGHKFLYVCYDNEAYMNTGDQRSSLTPFGASTTTSPAVGLCRVDWREEIQEKLV
jgi:pyruvate ferredoxin oxidoreductase beta subunit